MGGRKKTSESKVTDREYIYCNGCDKDVSVKNFYKSNGTTESGYIPYCKDCCYKYSLDNNGKFNIEKFKEMLQKIDKPFLYDMWDKCEQKFLEGKLRTYKSTIGNYIKNIAMWQYRDLKYRHSIFEPVKKEKDENINEVKDSDFKIKFSNKERNKLMDKWGFGYTDEEYYCFEKKWNKLVDNYGQKTSLHTEALTTYIRFRVKEELATARGDVAEATKWGALAEKAQTSGKLNVSQLSKSDISGGVDVVCQIFEALETEVGVIPLLPKLIEQPQDDADMIIWCLINYGRSLEDKPRVQYKDVWKFYNDMLNEFCNDKGFSEEEKQEYLNRRNNTFKDLGKLYNEPLYDENYEGNFEDEEN